MLAIKTSILLLLTTACVAQDPTPTISSSTPTQSYRPCDGPSPTPNPCPSGYVCIDNPEGDDGEDTSGICVEYEFCGGIAGTQCADGKKCIDYPDDSCDPMNGGFDCGGICVREKVSMQGEKASS